LFKCSGLNDLPSFGTIVALLRVQEANPNRREVKKMEKSRAIHSVGRGGPGGRRFLNGHRKSLVGLCLAFGAFTSGGCAVAPALAVGTALVSAVAVATEGERLIMNAGEPHTVIVKNETSIYSGPGEGYSRKGTLDKGDKVQVLGHQEGWVQCRSDRFDTGWIQGDVN
jgi:hypothetical protein